MEVLVSKVPIERIGGAARKHIQRIHARSAKELMTRDVITVREEMPVASALALSAEKRVKRLPLVSAAGQLIGIVGRTEIMRALHEGASHSRRNEEWRVTCGIFLVAFGGDIR